MGRWWITPQSTNPVGTYAVEGGGGGGEDSRSTQQATSSRAGLWTDAPNILPNYPNHTPRSIVENKFLRLPLNSAKIWPVFVKHGITFGGRGVRIAQNILRGVSFWFCFEYFRGACSETDAAKSALLSSLGVFRLSLRPPPQEYLLTNSCVSG